MNIQNYPHHRSNSTSLVVAYFQFLHFLVEAPEGPITYKCWCLVSHLYRSIYSSSRVFHLISVVPKTPSRVSYLTYVVHCPFSWVFHPISMVPNTSSRAFYFTSMVPMIPYSSSRVSYPPCLTHYPSSRVSHPTCRECISL